MKRSIKEETRLKDLYLDVTFKLAEAILKFQANDISKEDLFKLVKDIMRPDIYNNMYHMIVLKDYLGATFFLDKGNEDIPEDDTDTFTLKD